LTNMMYAVHQFGLFKFRTGHISAPSTPTASARSRTTMFGLDAISRNLFPGVMGRGGDVFGAVLNNHNPKRSRSAASRTSTQTATTMDSAIKFSTRSTSTAATSVLMDEDSYHGSPTRKLQRGRKSPSAVSSPARSRCNSRSRSRERGESPAHELDGHPGYAMDESDWDLNTRLELARRNSRNQHGKEPPTLATNPPVEDTIYEGKRSTASLLIYMLMSINS
jgi:protein ECT2